MVRESPPLAPLTSGRNSVIQFKYAYVPVEPTMLIVSDLDNVIIEGEYLPELAKLIGKKREVTEITKTPCREE